MKRLGVRVQWGSQHIIFIYLSAPATDLSSILILASLPLLLSSCFSRGATLIQASVLLLLILLVEVSAADHTRSLGLYMHLLGDDLLFLHIDGGGHSSPMGRCA